MVNLHEARQTRFVCVLLVLYGVVSFRSVPRLLAIVNGWRGRLGDWIPHFTSVINWTLRIGLGLLNAVGPVTYPWIAMMDNTIDVGTKKALVVLRVPLAALASKGAAIQLEDCEGVGLRVLEESNGETICDSLATIFNRVGAPVAILKDQGSDLRRGVALWKQRSSKEAVEVIGDIGHELANGLEAQFKKTKAFENFLAILRKGSGRLRQTSWAFLIPPKIRTKGRFQSIGKIAEWGSHLLTWLSRQEDGKQVDSAVIRKAFAGFPGCRAFIRTFAETTQIVHAVLKLLKQHGLDQTTDRHCRQLAHALPIRSKVRKRLLSWLDRHLAIQEKLTGGQQAIVVSTDILESLFGKFKRIIERSPGKDMNRMVLVIPALCGNRIDVQRIEQLFSATRHHDMEVWERDNITYTLRKKRRAFFDGLRETGVPKTSKNVWQFP